MQIQQRLLLLRKEHRREHKHRLPYLFARRKETQFHVRSGGGLHTRKLQRRHLGCVQREMYFQQRQPLCVKRHHRYERRRRRSGLPYVYQKLIFLPTRFIQKPSAKPRRFFLFFSYKMRSGRLNQSTVSLYDKGENDELLKITEVSYPKKFSSLNLDYTHIIYP